VRRNRMRCSASKALSICVFMAAFAVFAIAQAPVGTLTGIVTDPSGAVIRNAEITIRNKATGAERKLRSDEDGSFSAAALPAGEYEVQGQASGFRTLLRQVTLEVGAIARVEMTMEVGQKTEIVTVESSSAAQLNYESHTID